MLVARNDFSVGIYHIEAQAAELRTLSTVGTAAEACLTHVTLSAVTYTQRTVHEDLEQRIGTGSMYFGNLIERQLSCQHHLTETGIRQKLDLLHRTVVHLRTGMQRDRRQIELCNSHILNNQRIHSGTIQIPDHRFGVLQFLVTQDRIHRDINTDIVHMRILHQCGNVFQRIAGSRTCSETGSTDIHRIGTMIDSLDAALQIFCRSQ